MTAFDLELRNEILRRLVEVKERCLRQRTTMLMERERVRLCRELRHARARLLMRRAFSKEVEAVTRPLVESVDLN
jgi:hypothetical protein